MQALVCLDTRVLNHALKVALRRAGPTKTISVHLFRSAFPTHRLQCGPDIHTMQPLRGHDDLTIQEGVSRIAAYMFPSIRGQIGG
jgi:site-specific recombinase XerD